jgi:precorrin isomerase
MPAAWSIWPMTSSCRKGLLRAARAALAAGAPVLCDAEMVRHGVIGRLDAV